jgi:hypothetical protein
VGVKLVIDIVALYARAFVSTVHEVPDYADDADRNRFPTAVFVPADEHCRTWRVYTFEGAQAAAAPRVSVSANNVVSFFQRPTTGLVVGEWELVSLAFEAGSSPNRVTRVLGRIQTVRGLGDLSGWIDRMQQHEPLHSERGTPYIRVQLLHGDADARPRRLVLLDPRPLEGPDFRALHLLLSSAKDHFEKYAHRRPTATSMPRRPLVDWYRAHWEAQRWEALLRFAATFYLGGAGGASPPADPEQKLDQNSPEKHGEPRSSSGQHDARRSVRAHQLEDAGGDALAGRSASADVWMFGWPGSAAERNGLRRPPDGDHFALLRRPQSAVASSFKTISSARVVAARPGQGRPVSASRRSRHRYAAQRRGGTEDGRAQRAGHAFFCVMRLYVRRRFRRRCLARRRRLQTRPAVCSCC